MSMASGVPRRGCWEMTTLAPRASRSSMMAFASKALSAIKAPKATPSMSGGTANRVEAMSWQQLKAHEVAQGIGQCQNLGRHAGFGTADGLARSPPFAPCPWRWILTMVASTHGVFHVRIIRDGVEKPFELGFDPIAETREHAVPMAERGRQIAPWTAGPHDPKHRFDETAIITSAAPRIARLAEAMRFHLRPLGISQHESFHPKLESQPSLRRNLEGSVRSRGR